MKTDAQIQKDVNQELAWAPDVTQSHIGVSVSEGIVTLSGTIPNYAEKFAAERAAQRVSGVKAVVERMEVKLPSTFLRSDEDIAGAAVGALNWNVQVPDEKIKVAVDKGRVRLSGEVEWEFQRQAAADAIKGLAGVTGVSNDIRILPKVSPSHIKEKIEQALQRAAVRESRRIEVEVHGHTATLTGKVRSFREMFDARGAAFSAPGITEVINHLDVA